MIKNPDWKEVDQLAFYNRGRGAELEFTEKQLSLVVRDRDLKVSSPAPEPLGNAGLLIYKKT